MQLSRVRTRVESCRVELGCAALEILWQWEEERHFGAEERRNRGWGGERRREEGRWMERGLGERGRVGEKEEGEGESVGKRTRERARPVWRQ